MIKLQTENGNTRLCAHGTISEIFSDLVSIEEAVFKALAEETEFTESQIKKLYKIGKGGDDNFNN